MSLADELAAIAQALGLARGATGPYRYVRLYHGRHQRAAGAWSWMLLDGTGLEVMGSPDPAWAAVKAYKAGRLVADRGEVCITD